MAASEHAREVIELYNFFLDKQKSTNSLINTQEDRASSDSDELEDEYKSLRKPNTNDDVSNILSDVRANQTNKAAQDTLRDLTEQLKNLTTRKSDGDDEEDDNNEQETKEEDEHKIQTIRINEMFVKYILRNFIHVPDMVWKNVVSKINGVNGRYTVQQYDAQTGRNSSLQEVIQYIYSNEHSHASYAQTLFALDKQVVENQQTQKNHELSLIEYKLFEQIQFFLRSINFGQNNLRHDNPLVYALAKALTVLMVHNFTHSVLTIYVGHAFIIDVLCNFPMYVHAQTYQDIVNSENFKHYVQTTVQQCYIAQYGNSYRRFAREIQRECLVYAACYLEFFENYNNSQGNYIGASYPVSPDYGELSVFDYYNAHIKQKIDDAGRFILQVYSTQMYSYRQFQLRF